MSGNRPAWRGRGVKAALRLPLRQDQADLAVYKDEAVLGKACLAYVPACNIPGMALLILLLLCLCLSATLLLVRYGKGGTPELPVVPAPFRASHEAGEQRQARSS